MISINLLKKLAKEYLQLNNIFNFFLFFFIVNELMLGHVLG